MGQHRPPLLRRRILYAFSTLLAVVAIASVLLTGGSLYLYYLSTVKGNTRAVADRFVNELGHLQDAILLRARVLALADQWTRQAPGAAAEAQVLEVEAYRWLQSVDLRVDGKGSRAYWAKRDLNPEILSRVFDGQTHQWAQPVGDRQLRLYAAVPESGEGGVESMLQLSLTLDRQWLVLAAERVGGHVALCDMDGRVELSSFHGKQLFGRMLSTRPATLQIDIGDVRFGYQLFPVTVGEEQVGYFAAFSPATPLEDLSFRLSALLTTGFIAAMVIFFFLYRAAVKSSTSDLAALSQWADDYTKGGSSALPPTGRFQEVQSLSRAFGTLVEQLDSALGLLNLRKEQLETQVEEKTRELWNQHRLMDSMFNGMEQGVLLAEEDNVLLFVNKAARELFSVRPGDALPAKLLEQFKCDSGAHVPAQHRIGQRDYLLTCNGLEASGRQLLLVQDVTEQLALENQLQQAQKLESVGRLAGGVAHDFNNALGSILPTVDMLRLRIEDPKSRNYIDAIEQAAIRAADVVRQLLTFSRSVAHDTRTLDFNATVDGAISLFRPSAKKIKVTWEPGELEHPILGDAAQLQQMILNLAFNALDAVEEGKGEIRFATWASRKPPMVHLAVTDSGPGIDPAISEKIFDPFFTTKDESQGSGLGLSVAYGVVENHGGKLRLVLPEQGGCRFEVDLPALTDAEKDELTGSRSCRSSEEIIIGG